jgi:hypothetical protein
VTLATIARATTEPLIRLKIRRAASWTARYDTRSAPAAAARSLIAEIDRHDEDLLTSAMLGSIDDMVPRGADFLTTSAEPVDEDFQAADQRHATERQQAVEALWASVEDPVTVISHLTGRQRAIQLAGRLGEGTGAVVEAVVRAQPEQARALLKALCDTDVGPLDEHAHYILDEITRRDPSAFIGLLDQLLAARPSLASGALIGYAIHDWLSSIPVGGTGLERGLSHPVDPVRQTAIRATAMLLSRTPEETATRLLPHASAAAEGIMQAINKTAGQAHDRWLGNLDEDARSAITSLQAAAGRVGGSA